MAVVFLSKTNKDDLPKRIKDDFYETPVDFCMEAVARFPGRFPRYSDNNTLMVLDPGCGNGNWGVAVKEHFANVYLRGIDINKDRTPGVHYDDVVYEDYLNYETDNRFDLIIGNPPFKHAMDFVLKSFDLLSDRGFIYFLFKLSFLESKVRYNKLFSDIYRCPSNILVSTSRIDFTGQKNQVDSYGMFMWRYDLTLETNLDWIDWK